MFKKSALSIAVAIILTGTGSISSYAADKKFITSAEIMPVSVAAMPACLEYKVLGAELRMIIKPTKIILFVTLRVSHNNPDLLSMSHQTMLEVPWLEWAVTLGMGSQVAAEATAFAALKQLLGANTTGGIHGGQSRKGGYGAHQDTTFKESTQVGNPALLIMKILSGAGEGALSGNLIGGLGNVTEGLGKIDWSQFSPEELAQLPADAVNKIKNTNWAALGDKAYQQAQDLILDMILPSGVREALAVAMQAAEFVKMIQDLYDLANGIANGLNMGAGVRIDRLFCPSSVTIAEPYFHSGMDGVLWRTGYPITDVSKGSTIINPFSGDRIGPSGKTDLWGHLYPRHGFWNHDWDYKGGALTVARSAEIILKGGDGHIKSNPDDAGHGGWQLLHPTPTSSCRKNIANTMSDGDNNLKLNYGWTWWRKYECSLAPSGTLIAYIPFNPPISLTPDVPE